MPAIDYSGAYHVAARSTVSGSRAAISFPIKASRTATAKRFAEREVLRMLPGWTMGHLSISRNGTWLESWLLARPKPSKKGQRR